QSCNDRVSHRGSGEGGLTSAGEVRGAMSAIQRCAHGVLDARGLTLELERVAQQHGDRKNCPERVRNSLSGDVRRRTMDGLVQTDGAADACGRQQAEGAYYSAGLVRENVADN